MKKLRLLNVFEGFFSPATPGPENAHQFNKTRSVGDPINDQSGLPDTMTDEEIGAELSLEFKLGPTMRDPVNLPGYNVHDGSFSNGKSSKPFGNFQTKNKNQPDPSQEEVMVMTIDGANPESGLSIMSDPEIASELGLEKPKSKPYTEKNRQTKKRGQEQHWKDAKSQSRPLEEDVGMREKGRAYGSPITTKQPFANGMPKLTDVPFLSDEEIARELGLMEWISSSPIFNRHAKGPKAELDFFNNNRPLFTMNTEEEFNDNQKVKNEKKKKRKIKR